MESEGKDLKWAWDLLSFARNAMEMGEETNTFQFIKRIRDGLDKENERASR